MSWGIILKQLYWNVVAPRTMFQETVRELTGKSNKSVTQRNSVRWITLRNASIISRLIELNNSKIFNRNLKTRVKIFQWSRVCYLSPWPAPSEMFCLFDLHCLAAISNGNALLKFCKTSIPLATYLPLFGLNAPQVYCSRCWHTRTESQLQSGKQTVTLNRSNKM